MPLVYLAGPIDGTTYSESTDWREFAEAWLRDIGIHALSPMRGKEFLKNAGIIKGSYDDTPWSTDRGLTTRDMFDVMRADVILANFLGATGKSLGTAFEIGAAYVLQKPVVIVMDEENVHQHPMIRAASPYIMPTLLEALEIVATLLPDAKGVHASPYDYEPLLVANSTDVFLSQEQVKEIVKDTLAGMIASRMQ